MTTIKKIHARQILDSRGNPTLEVDCELENGKLGRAGVPSGASTGTHEALELRDGDPNVYGGKSVNTAVENVNTTINDHLHGTQISDHRTIDQMLIDLDGTPNKSRLGANAILGASMAICRARAWSEQRPLWQSLAEQYEVGDPTLLPTPMMNVINGGAHADNSLSFQEFMIIPSGFSTYSDALRAGVETFHELRRTLKEQGKITAVGDEGGFAPSLSGSDEAFTILLESIDRAGYSGKIQFAIDAAASEFCTDGVYDVDGQKLTSLELSAYYEELTKKYPLVSIEDSHSEDDWEGFADLTARVGDTVQLVGDDLLVTNVERIQKAIDAKTVNAVLIKLNQIGTVSETVDAINLAKQNQWGTIVSHRSGETKDTFIAHLSVAIESGQIKTGSLCRTDRMAKYNQLLRIEDQLEQSAVYRSPFS